MAGVTVIAGCSSNSDSSDSKGKNAETTEMFLSPARMEEEYWRETKALALPDGVEWLPVVHQPPAPDHQGVMRDHTYEPGYGHALAQDAWFCAWQKEWIAQRG